MNPDDYDHADDSATELETMRIRTRSPAQDLVLRRMLCEMIDFRAWPMDRAIVALPGWFVCKPTSGSFQMTASFAAEVRADRMSIVEIEFTGLPV